MCQQINAKVALVTGSNKGIGFAIVKGLLESDYPGVVYLTSRDVSNGLEAVGRLNKLGFNVAYHQLDITNSDSVDGLVNTIKDKHGGVDLLVNNAAIKYSSTSTVPLDVQVAKTLETNYYGTKRVCEALLPLLRHNAQVINVSSAAGHVCAVPDLILRKRFTMDITVEKLEAIITDYRVKITPEIAKQWKNIGYVLSKVAVCAYTVAQQKLFDTGCDFEGRNIRINSVHPGYVASDMTSWKGVQTPEEGAKSTLFLALNDQHAFKGDFIWYDCKRVEWTSDIMPKDIKTQ